MRTRIYIYVYYPSVGGVAKLSSELSYVGDGDK